MPGGNFGPLTSVFTPPETCQSMLSTTWRLSVSDGHYYNAGPTATSDCFPPSYDDARTNYFSPGLYCPYGYTTACQSIVLNTATTAAQETVATCCPSISDSGAFTCNTENGFSWQSTEACRQAFFEGATGTVPTTITVFSVAYSRSTSITTSGTDDTDTHVSTTSSTVSAVTTVTNDAYQNAAVNAFGVVLRWKASDNETSSGQGSSSSENGLSTAAAAGIGVGVAVGVLMIIGLAVFAFVMGRRRRRREEATAAAANVGDSGTPPEYGHEHGHAMGQYPASGQQMDAVSPNSPDKPRSPTEIYSPERAELSPTTPTRSLPVELGALDIHEMPGEGIEDRQLGRRDSGRLHV